jgi:hypothetical protein
VDANELAPRHIEANGLGTKRQHQRASSEDFAGDLHSTGIDDADRSVQHELDVELLLALVVHDGMRPSAATPEQVDNFLDREGPSRYVRKPEASRKGAGKHQLCRTIRKNVVRDTCVVRT